MSGPKLLAIDPGVQFTGAAIFDLTTKKLFAAKRIRGTGFRHEMWSILDLARDIASFASPFAPYMALAMEWPQVYSAKQRGRKDPNDLLPLAALEGALIATLDPLMETGASCELYQPHSWKGSKKANPTARWILEKLEDKEKAQIQDLDAFLVALAEAERKTAETGKQVDVNHPAHNTIDGVGVGLHYLGRLGRTRVIAR